MNILEELNESLSEMTRGHELPEDYEVFVYGDWVYDLESWTKADIIKHLPSGRFFQASFCRTVDTCKTECTSVQRWL